ncbi:hypothetical protein [uncultured Sphingomonas sp.]|uniref:hypothetical protein n=1 Tax=uncultured Sphingomonas sp. TaxID=158754 RepID=UPI0035CB1056
MKELLTFLSLCAVLAIANAFTMALAIALLFAALLGAITHPRRTFGLAAALGIMALALKEPFACVGALAAVGAVGIVVGRLGRRSASRLPGPVHLLTHSRGGEKDTTGQN